MDDHQRAAASALVRAALSDAGYRKATDIVRLEEVLRAIERVRRFRRDPDNYAWSLFGDPESEAPRGFRVEGHHLSLNFTFAPGSPGSVTPAFMGANPARVPSGPLEGLRVLGVQEDIARELVRGLSPAERERAIIAAQSLGNIVSGPGRADALRSPVGLSIGDMSPSQRTLAKRLIEEFVGNLGTELAEAQRARIREAGLGAIHFAGPARSSRVMRTTSGCTGRGSWSSTTTRRTTRTTSIRSGGTPDGTSRATFWASTTAAGTTRTPSRRGRACLEELQPSHDKKCVREHWRMSAWRILHAGDCHSTAIADGRRRASFLLSAGPAKSTIRFSTFPDASSTNASGSLVSLTLGPLGFCV